ncbi:MAG: DUF1513 domain-containing protein [Pseudomonadota bacterium]
MRRRSFLAASAAALTAPAWAALGDPAFLAAAREPDGRYALFGLTAFGQIAFRVPLPARGHAAAAHPTRAEAVAFARRPGTFALVLDCATGQTRHRLEPPAGHHFYGHGTYLDGGNTLVTTENAYEIGDGRLGLWDATDDHRRIGDIPSGGIGPHEVIRLPGTDTLAVANGGIRTHPATGREKLNLDTMRPNLTYIRDGHVIERVDLPDPKLSIRHLTARADGTVAMGLQSQSDPSAHVPLVATHRQSQAPKLRGADLAPSFQGYVGSIAWSGDGTRLAATGPRGNRAAIWTGASVDLLHRTDICGVAPAGRNVAFTDGTGGVLTEAGAAKHSVAWDNHLVALS